MSDDYKTRLAALEQLDEDLFAFPDINGMADLLSASRGEAANGDSVPAPLPATAAKAPAPATKTAPVGGNEAKAAPAEPKAPLPVSNAAPAKGAPSKSAPKNEGDLDEDLFGFGELIDLGAATSPAAGAAADDELEVVASEQRATSKPAMPPATPAASAPAASTTATLAAAATTTPPTKAPAAAKADAAAGSETPAEKERKPKTKKDNKPTVVVREKRREGEAQPAPTRAAAEPEPAAVGAGAGSPFLQFPASIDLPPAKSKLLWVLVGCFLLANGGIFLMTQQQNENVNRTLIAVTSTLADAVARGSQAAPQQIEAPAPRERDPELESEARPEVPMLDASDYTNTHEFGVEAARKLIQLGEYAEARRTLFMVLANQDRGTPMAPSLREDIDYLIALTYYDQGRSIAPEVNE